MKRFCVLKNFLVSLIIAAFLLSSFGCTYKPAYLQKAKGTEIAERWRVEQINSSRLSPDEKSVYETMGSPQFVRFYRKLSLDREKVYAWVYTEPVAFVTFIDGKKVDYAVLDDNLTRFNEHERKILFWGGIAAGTVVALGALAYYFLLKE